MEEKLILTPEQLFFLGTVMGAEAVPYDYIAAMGEVQRNYSRTHRKCMDDLARAGLLRERLSGGVVLRPAAKALLEPVFFGEKTSTLEVFQMGKEESHRVFRFHRRGSAVTQLEQSDGMYLLSQSGPEQMEAFVAQQVRGAERPMRMGEIFHDSVTRMLMIKRAVIEQESTCVILFEQFGSLYRMDDSDKPQAIPASQARAMLLAELKGE